MFKARATFLCIVAGNLSGILLTGKLFSRTNGALFHETPLFSRICNSAAVSWGFAIPTSTVFCFLSNRIINSYIHGRRIANSPEQELQIAFGFPFGQRPLVRLNRAEPTELYFTKRSPFQRYFTGFTKLKCVSEKLPADSSLS